MEPAPLYLLASERHLLNFRVFVYFNYVCSVNVADKLYMFRELCMYFMLSNSSSLLSVFDQY